MHIGVTELNFERSQITSNYNFLYFEISYKISAENANGWLNVRIVYGHRFKNKKVVYLNRN